MSRLVARYCNATTPGSLETNNEDPLLALAWATEETPMYITSELISDKLYESTDVSVTPGNLKRSLRDGRKEGLPRLRRYWSK